MDTDLWKYVDDTTISENVPEHEHSSIQTSVHELTRNSTADKFQLTKRNAKNSESPLQELSDVLHLCT